MGKGAAPMDAPLAFATPASAGTLVVSVLGDVDLATASAFRMLLQSAAQFPATVVVDLSDVRFMDCAGLAPLLEAHARMGDRLQLRGLRPAVHLLLLLTGLDALFAVPDQPSSESAPPDTERRTRALPEQSPVPTGTRSPTLVTASPSKARP
jgi:anti-anti-sigma factor